VGQIFKILILKFLVILSESNQINFTFGVSYCNGVSCILALNFYRRFFTLRELMPVDGFIKQYSCLGREASVVEKWHWLTVS